MNKNNVIVAIATAKAEAAIGIIRMSGEGSINIIDQIFIATDKKILNEEIMKIYNFEFKKTKSILFEWLLQGYKDRRF